MLICKRCLQAFNTGFVFAPGLGGAMMYGNSCQCQFCGLVQPIPDMSFNTTLAGIIISLKAEDSSRVSFGDLLNPLRTVTNAEEIDRAISSPELQWIRPFLPAHRDEWVPFVQAFLFLFLSVIAISATHDLKDAISHSSNIKLVQKSYNEITLCYRLVSAVLDEAWRHENPGIFLNGLKHKILSCNTVGAFRRSWDISLPWLKAIVPQTPDVFGEFVRDVLVYSVIPSIMVYLATKAARKPEKPNAHDMASDAYKHLKDQGLWK
jgi:hypothetical protein